ncbi:MAG TPA: type III pantothenate kinase, partial [Thermoanaerobaculia bacterium]|nr:type III pantothenate kinase [Thermoanaerobaculia bacterium]
MGLLLALDVGNTNTVIGFFQGEALVATARLTTVRERTSDEHSLFLRAVIEAKGRRVEEIDDVIVSSVVPSQDFPIRTACRDAFGIDPLFVAPGVKTGMKILYDHPSEVGADRIVNAVAALVAYGAPCIVVDFGTATTFDVVTAGGDYLGGVICPGPGISADALFSRAARLSRVDLHRPEKVVGKNTAQSIQSGLYWGVLAQAEGLIARIRAELGEPKMKVVVTGGLAPLFSAASSDLALVDSDLTLRGLKILHDRNA